MEITKRDAILAASALSSLAHELENDEIKQALARVAAVLAVADTVSVVKSLG